MITTVPADSISACPCLHHPTEPETPNDRIYVDNKPGTPAPLPGGGLLQGRDARFAADFARLIHQERLDDVDRFLKPVELFDEPPLYSRFGQLAFLDGLPVEQKNRLLIRAAAAHLHQIVEHGREHDFYCMLCILVDFDTVDGSGLLIPAFWYTNPSTRPDPTDPRGILDYLVFDLPTSHYSGVVADALDHDPAFVIQDDEGTDIWGRRVYVRLGRYWSDAYQTLR